MSYELHDQIFDEFCKMCPWAAPKVSKWYETGSLEIIIELKDGSAMHYDYILKTFRYEPSLDELLEKLKAYTEEMKEQVVAKDARLQETGYKNYSK